MKKQIYFIGFFLFLSHFTFGQATIEEQIRITVNNDELSDFEVIPGKKIVAFGTPDVKNTDPVLLLKIYDKNLSEIQSKEIKIFDKKTSNFSYLSKDSTELYFIAYTRNKMQTIAYNFETDETENHLIELDKSAKSIASLFTAATAGSKIFMLGYLKKAPCLLSVDMHHGTTSLIVPTGSTKKTIMKIISDEHAKDITLGFYSEKIKKADTYNILHISENGELDNTFIRIPMQEGKTLLNGTFSYGKKDDFYVVGGYSKSGTTAQGIYLVHGNGQEIVETKFYDFDEVQDFYSYLPQRKQERMEKKQKKNKLNTSALVTVHGIEKLGKDFVILGEVFYPTYRTESYTVYVNGQPQIRYRQVFDGYQYTHSVIIETDAEYNMKSNAVFLMNTGKKPFRVIQFVRIETGKKNLIFTYNSHEEANTYTYSDGELSKVDAIKLPQRDKNTNEKYQYVGTLATNKWYGNYFISAHTEIVKDKEAERGQRKQHYLVFTKIRI